MKHVFWGHSDERINHGGILYRMMACLAHVNVPVANLTHVNVPVANLTHVNVPVANLTHVNVPVAKGHLSCGHTLPSILRFPLETCFTVQ